MAFLTANGLPVTSGEIVVPRTGHWQATLTVDGGPDDISKVGGAVSLAFDGGPTWKGTARAPGLAAPNGPLRLRVVGGAGKLGTSIAGQSYRQAAVRQLVSQLLEAAGEQLSPTSDQALLARILTRWSRAEGPATYALCHLVGELSCLWRVLPDGRVWLGKDAGAAAPEPPVGAITSDDPVAALVEFSVADPWRYAPGQRWRGSPVDLVQHTLAASRLRTTLWLRSS